MKNSPDITCPGDRALLTSSGSVDGFIRPFTQSEGNVAITVRSRLIPRSLEEAAVSRKRGLLRFYLRFVSEQSRKNQAFLLAIQARQCEQARILVKHGADVNACNSSGNSALYQACLTSPVDYTAVEWLLSVGARANAVSRDGYVPLHVAAYTADSRLADLLLGAGADPNALGPSGGPLHLACSGNYKLSQNQTSSIGSDIVSILLLRGANPNLQAPLELQTPLHAITVSPVGDLVEERLLGIVNILLAHGAIPSIQDKQGKTPLDYAKENGLSKIAKVLRKASEPPLDDPDIRPFLQGPNRVTDECVCDVLRSIKGVASIRFP